MAGTHEEPVTIHLFVDVIRNHAGRISGLIPDLIPVLPNKDLHIIM